MVSYQHLGCLQKCMKCLRTGTFLIHLIIIISNFLKSWPSGRIPSFHLTSEDHSQVFKLKHLFKSFIMKIFIERNTLKIICNCISSSYIIFTISFSLSLSFQLVYHLNSGKDWIPQSGKVLNSPKWESVRCSVVSNFLQPHKLWLAKLFCPWDFPVENTGVGSYSLQGIFPTQGSNPGLLHCRQILYCLSQQGSHKEKSNP